MTPTFLIINKIGTLRRLTVHILKTLGYTSIKEAVDLKDAEAQIEEMGNRVFSLIIIMELTLSNLSAEFDFFKLFKKTRKKINTHLIITSPCTDKKLVLEAGRNGVEIPIIKTMDLQSFGSKLEKILEKADIFPLCADLVAPV
jgi:response regulator of citrate/malate metabolism